MCEKHPILDESNQGFIERCVKWISIGSLPTPDVPLFQRWSKALNNDKPGNNLQEAKALGPAARHP